MRRVALLGIVASALLVAGVVAALATPSVSSGAAGQAAGTQMGNVGMRLKVHKFVRRHHRLVRQGQGSCHVHGKRRYENGQERAIQGPRDRLASRTCVGRREPDRDLSGLKSGARSAFA